MNILLTLDKAGRVLIPKELRDELRLEAGDKMELQALGENLTLRPVRSTSPLRKEKGIWVFYGSRKLSAASTDKALEAARQERDTINGRPRE